MSRPDGTWINLDTIDPNVKRVILRMRQRTAEGMEEYGVDTTREDYGLIDWLAEVRDESLDRAVYAEAAIQSGVDVAARERVRAAKMIRGLAGSIQGGLVPDDAIRALADKVMGEGPDDPIAERADALLAEPGGRELWTILQNGQLEERNYPITGSEFTIRVFSAPPEIVEAVRRLWEMAQGA